MNTQNQATLIALVSAAALIAAAETTAAQPAPPVIEATGADQGYAPDTNSPRRPPTRAGAPTSRYARPAARSQGYPGYGRWPQYPAYAPQAYTPQAYGYPQDGRTDSAYQAPPAYPTYGGWGSPWGNQAPYSAYGHYPVPPMAPPVDPGAGDDDGDSVINRLDRCPDTPTHEAAGVFGCAVGEAFVVPGIDFDSEGTLTTESYAKLDELADILIASPGQKIEISGHTDATDNAGRDEWVSAYRAIAVMKHLADRGVIVEDMIARAYGGTRPVASNDTEEGREANRRIEIIRIQ